MNYYLLFKSLHLISIISWMAGLLYLPRLFVYYAETVNNKENYEVSSFSFDHSIETIGNLILVFLLSLWAHQNPIIDI